MARRVPASTNGARPEQVGTQPARLARFEDYSFDLVRQVLSHRGRPVHLEPQVAELLAHLIRLTESTCLGRLRLGVQSGASVSLIAALCSCAEATQTETPNRGGPQDASEAGSGGDSVVDDSTPEPTETDVEEGGVGGAGPSEDVAGGGGVAGGSSPSHTAAGASGIAEAGSAAADSGTTGPNAGVCQDVEAFAAQEVEVERLVGDDDLGLALVTPDRASLRLTSSGHAPEALVARFFSDFQADESADPPVCLRTSFLVFAQRERPIVGVRVDYALNDVSTEWFSTDGHTPIFFVDVKRGDDPSLWSVGSTVDYVGTTGTYEFIELDEPGEYCQELLGCSAVFYHSLRFDVKFNAVTAGEVDESVVTRLSGELRFFSSEPW